MWKGPTKLVMKWPHLSYSIQKKLKSINIVNKPIKQPNNIVVISKTRICQLNNFEMLKVLSKGCWHTIIGNIFANFVRTTKSLMCPFYTCRPPTFLMHKKMWLGVWNSAPNIMGSSSLSTSFLRFTTSRQSSTSQWHVELLSTSWTPVFKLLWSNKNPIEHECWHICFFSFFPMCCNIGYFSIKFIMPNICQSITPFDLLKCMSIILLHQHMCNLKKNIFY